MKPYTPKERAAMSEAFKAAQKHQPEQHFVCCSLAKAGDVDPSIIAGSRLAQKEVRRRIRPHTVVSSWLKQHGHCDKKPSFKALKVYRARWLASLVAEFSNP